MVASWLDNVVALLVVFVSVGSVCGESSCPACNCQFSNVQSLAVLVTRIVNDTLFSGLLDDAIQRQFGKSAIHTSLGCLMMLLTLLNVSLVKSFFSLSLCALLMYYWFIATWTPVTLTSIGLLNIDSASTFHFQIPSIIPHNSSEFLLYAYLACGHAAVEIDSDITFYVEDGGVRFEKFLHLQSYSQDAWNTNSDNMWFLMPADRQIHVNVQAAAGGNCYAHLYVIGYR